MQLCSIFFWESERCKEVYEIALIYICNNYFVHIVKYSVHREMYCALSKLCRVSASLEILFLIIKPYTCGTLNTMHVTYIFFQDNTFKYSLIYMVRLSIVPLLLSDTLLNNTHYRVKHNSNDVSKLNVNGYLIERDSEHPQPREN